MNRLSQALADLSPEQRDLLMARLVQRRREPAGPPPLCRRERGRRLCSLSYAQQRLWTLEQLDPGSAAYNMPMALRLPGPLVVRVLQRSFDEVARRHEILRARCVLSADGPMQIVDPPAPVALPVIDLTGLPSVQRDRELRRLAAREARRSMDLARGPLLRARLARLGDEDHAVLVTLHHIVSDGWSMGILAREIAALYTAFATARPSPLPELPIQYPDFAAWQRGWLRGEVLEARIAAVRRRLAGAPPVLDLAGDRSRPAQRSRRGGRKPVAIADTVTGRLKAWGRKQGGTLYLTLLAAFVAHLFRHTGERDLVVGTPVAGRDRVELEELIGFFVNTLVLRLDVGGDPTFRELVARLRDAVLAAQEHQDLPFDKLVEAINPERSLSHSPLFQVMFCFQNTPTETRELPRLPIEPVDFPVETSRFDLVLDLAGVGTGLAGFLEYSTDLFDAATGHRLVERYRLVLSAVAEDPERRLSELSLLAAAERHQLLVEWNDSQRELEGEATLRGLVARQAVLTPEAIAVVDGERCASYGALTGWSGVLAARLTGVGVGPEAIVGICLERSLEMVTAQLATLEAGGAYLPLDPSYPEGRLVFMTCDASAVCVIAGDGLPSALAEAAPALVRLGRVEDLPPRRPMRREPTLADNLAYVIYTSGSTGNPKGVMISHRAIVNRLLWMQRLYPLGAEDGVLQKTPYSFDASVWEIFVPLLAGARLALAAPGGHQDTGYLAGTVARQRLTTLQLVPSLVPAFLEEPGVARACRTLRRFFCGGEELPAEVAARIATQLGVEAVVNLYGATEASIDTTSHRLGRAPETTATPLGRPLDNLRVHLLDSDLRPVPLGVAGEICVGGRGLARGYRERPAATAERFVPHPFPEQPADRLYRSGDLARHLPDGALDFLGRLDFQVKVRGFRIELGEIEAAVRRQPEVREAVAVVRDGEAGGKRLVVYAVLAAGREEEVDLRGFLQRELPEHVVPAAAVILGELPRTPSGKIDRRALPAPDWGAGRDVAYVAPRTDVELQLAALWGELLGVERVGAYDNFFALGGDSILAIQVVHRAVRAGLALQPRQIFQHQTVAELASVVGTGGAVEAAQGVVHGSLPLTPIQRWFFAQEFADSHHWNQTLMLAMDGALAHGPLSGAAGRLLAHHDALRLRFAYRGDGWQAWIADLDPAEPPPIAVVDLSGLGAARRRPVLESVAAAVQGSLDLEHGPLLRVVAFELGGGQGVRLMLVLHHLAVDGVSWRILLEDLQALYGGLVRGERLKLPPKTTSLRYWAQRLAGHAAEGGADAEATYWLEQAALAGVGLPLDRRRGRADVRSARTVSVALDREATRALLHEVPQAYRTRIDEVLLAALGRVLCEWVGREAVLVELEGHGREDLFPEVDLSRTTGWFTVQFPLLLEAGRGPGDALKRVKERRRRVPQGGIGYWLLRYLGGERDDLRRLRSSPPPEISFNYLGRLDSGAESAFLRFAEESQGSDRSPRGHLPHLLAVDANVSGQRLRVHWRFSTNRHRRSTIGRLAQRFRAELRSLIQHCCSPQAGGVTPSDFPLARLDEAGLERFVAVVREVYGPAAASGAGSIEDVYPLSPLQQSLLHHVLTVPGSRAGFEQITATLEGDLDLDAFERSWWEVSARHPILRSSFFSRGVPEPLQVVLRRAQVPCERRDWSRLDDKQRRSRLDRYLAADLERGFDPERAPLMRLALLRTGEHRHELVWSCHHLIIDAWCREVVLRELFTLYSAFCRGEEPNLSPARSFRDYIAWLERQNLAAAEAYWREALRGLGEPPPLWIDRLSSAAWTPKGSPYQALPLPAPTAAAVAALARRHRLTLATLVQGAWSLLLSRYSGRREVVFGITVSGRPAELSGVESMVGMFINNLPVRVSATASAPADAWLGGLQQQIATVQQFNYCSLSQIQQWSGRPAGRRLFDSLVLVQNHPVAGAGEVAAPAALTARAGWSRLETGYPLTLVADSGGGLRLLLSYDGGRFDVAAIRRALGHLHSLLAGIAVRPDAPLGALQLLSAAERHQLRVEVRCAAGGGLPEALRPLVGVAAGSGGLCVELLAPDGSLVPGGVPGEICVWGPDLPPSRGSSPCRQALRYTPDPCGRIAGGRLMHSGHWGRRLSGGGIESLGRRRDRIRRGGHEVWPGEVESLLRRHSRIADVVVRERDVAGERSLVAYLVPAPGAVLHPAELRRFLLTFLPDPAVPAGFVTLASLPYGADGRVDPAALPPPQIARLAVVAARNPMELRLVRIWEELLDHRPVGVTDDFFTLGGYSALAVRLVTRIARETGHELPLDALLGGATIERLAARLTRQQGAERSHAPLVEIQPGSGGPPLYCAHPVGGGVYCYVELAYCMGPQQTLYGLEAPGWHGEAPPLRKVEDMAARYLEAIAGVQPTGPYNFAGWSFGGLIALEMAQRVVAAGERVANLAIFDAALVGERGFDEAQLMLDFVRFFGTELTERIDADELRRRRGFEQRAAYVLSQAESLGQQLTTQDVENVRQLFDVYRSAYEAEALYEPRPYAGKVLLFRAAERRARSLADPSLGWRRIAGNGVEIIDVPGRHTDMLERPWVEPVASRLRLALAAIQHPVVASKET